QGADAAELLGLQQLLAELVRLGTGHAHVLADHGVASRRLVVGPEPARKVVSTRRSGALHRKSLALGRLSAADWAAAAGGGGAGGGGGGGTAPLGWGGARGPARGAPAGPCGPAVGLRLLRARGRQQSPPLHPRLQPARPGRQHWVFRRQPDAVPSLLVDV